MISSVYYLSCSENELAIPSMVHAFREVPTPMTEGYTYNNAILMRIFVPLKEHNKF
jgi:hypothetical protein